MADVGVVAVRVAVPNREAVAEAVDVLRSGDVAGYALGQLLHVRGAAAGWVGRDTAGFEVLVEHSAVELESAMLDQAGGMQWRCHGEGDDEAVETERGEELESWEDRKEGAGVLTSGTSPTLPTWHWIRPLAPVHVTSRSGSYQFTLAVAEVAARRAAKMVVAFIVGWVGVVVEVFRW